MDAHDTISIFDFGSQYTQLIARKIRRLNVYTEIISHDKPLSEVKNSKGFIFSGGPSSVYEAGFPEYDSEIMNSGIPLLGICLGMQSIAYQSGGKVQKGRIGEYGSSVVTIHGSGRMFEGLGPKEKVWMSHGDSVEEVPDGFKVLATSEDGIVAAFGNPERQIYGLQFHPEVSHTSHGDRMLENFVVNICGCRQDWTPKNCIQEIREHIRQQIGSSRSAAFLSGGVDSMVAYSLVAGTEGVGRVYPIFVNNGLLRKDETPEVEGRLKRLGVNGLISVDYSQAFLDVLKGVTDPEIKRQGTGDLFMKIQETEIEKLGLDRDTLLIQGSLYTDFIESGFGVGRVAQRIKTHHNIGSPLVQRRRERGLLVEPLKDLFKDDVRYVGLELGLPEETIWRHPFPGPGLAVRMIGEVTPRRLDILREVDWRYIEDLKKLGFYNQIWQAFAALSGAKSVGVMGDNRTYKEFAVLRAVKSEDGMTAEPFDFPEGILQRITERIVNEVPDIGRVLYDTTPKPPATIELE